MLQNKETRFCVIFFSEFCLIWIPAMISFEGRITTELKTVRVVWTQNRKFSSQIVKYSVQVDRPNCHWEKCILEADWVFFIEYRIFTDFLMFWHKLCKYSGNILYSIKKEHNLFPSVFSKVLEIMISLPTGVPVLDVCEFSGFFGRAKNEISPRIHWSSNPRSKVSRQLCTLGDKK